MAPSKYNNILFPSAEIRVETNAPLTLIQQHLQQSQLVLQESHTIDLTNLNPGDIDYFRMHGHKNVIEDNDEEEESNDSSDGEVNIHIIKLSTLDALRAYVVLKSTIDLGRGCTISEVRFAYNETFGYCINNKGNETLSGFSWTHGTYCFSIIQDKGRLNINPGRLHNQTDEDDVDKAVGCMFAIRREYTRNQLKKSDVITNDGVKQLLNNLPDDFYHAIQISRDGTLWKAKRDFFRLGFDLDTIMARAIQLMSSTSTTNDNGLTNVVELSAFGPEEMLAKYDDEMEGLVEAMWKSLIDPNSNTSYDVAKIPYGEMIGVSKHDMSLRELLTLQDYDEVVSSFSDRDVMVYSAKKIGTRSNMHDVVSGFNVKSCALGLLMNKIASKTKSGETKWNSTCVEEFIKELLDYGGNRGRLWLLSRGDDRTFNATIINWDDIGTQCAKTPTEGSIYRAYRCLIDVKKEKRKKKRNEEEAGNEEAEEGNESNADSGSRRGSSRGMAAVTYGSDDGDDEDDEEAVGSDSGGSDSD